MNDRYLFRAKHSLESKKWHIGNLVEEPDGLYLRDNKNNIMVYIQDPSTICQCTGLKDKNGKLIWENDVVKEFNSCGDEWNLSQIVFADYSLNLGWCAKGIKTLHEYNHRLFNVGFDKNKASKCEVIGNIFDNTELIYE